MPQEYMETNVLVSDHVVLAASPIRVALRAANGEFTAWMPIANAEALIAQLTTGVREAKAHADERAEMDAFRARREGRPIVAADLVARLNAAAAAE